MPALVIQPAAFADEPDSARQATLMHLLKQDCGSCHGMTLKGGLGLPLLPENLAGKPRGMLVATILEGRAGTAMPPWGGQLSTGDAEWLVDTLLQGVPDAN
jgi:cytochrome c55X